jgi:hypothetical protein
MTESPPQRCTAAHSPRIDRVTAAALHCSSLATQISHGDVPPVALVALPSAHTPSEARSEFVGARYRYTSNRTSPLGIGGTSSSPRHEALRTPADRIPQAGTALQQTQDACKEACIMSSAEMSAYNPNSNYAMTNEKINQRTPAKQSPINQPWPGRESSSHRARAAGDGGAAALETNRRGRDAAAEGQAVRRTQNGGTLSSAMGRRMSWTSHTWVSTPSRSVSAVTTRRFTCRPARPSAQNEDTLL